jgi:hypothetical protein
MKIMPKMKEQTLWHHECYQLLTQKNPDHIIHLKAIKFQELFDATTYYIGHVKLKTLLHLLFMESSISDATGKIIHPLALHYVWQHQLLGCHSIATHPCEISHLQVSQLKKSTQSWQFSDSYILQQTFWFRPSVRRKDNPSNTWLTFLLRTCELLMQSYEFS